MKVSEYRELIGQVRQWHLSLTSAVTGDEQRREANSLRRALDELRAAKCKTATAYDGELAEAVIASAEFSLAQKLAKFREADANLSRMAFAGEWR